MIGGHPGFQPLYSSAASDGFKGQRIVCVPFVEKVPSGVNDLADFLTVQDLAGLTVR